MKKVLKVGRRLPEAICFKLRHHGGGAHSSKKGLMGYSRKKGKQIKMEER